MPASDPPFSDQLARLVPDFEAELAEPGERFRFDILEEAREVNQDNLCTVTDAILAGYPGPRARAGREPRLGDRGHHPRRRGRALRNGGS